MNGTNFATAGTALTSGPEPGNTPSPDMIASQQLLCMNSLLAAAAATSSVFKQPPQPAVPPQGTRPSLSPYTHPFAFTPYGPYGPNDFGPKMFPRLSGAGGGHHNGHQDSNAHSVHHSQHSLHHSHRFGVEDPKPQHSYIGLIAKAILTTPERKMVLADIYQHILDNYSYFRNRGPGWRNSIRHNLSLNDCFMKSGRSANGKGHYWAIHPANLEDFIKGDFRRRKAQRKVRRHMGLSVPDDDEDDDEDESPLNSPNAMMSGLPHHPLGLNVNTGPLLPGGGGLPDPATALLLASNPQLLSMSAPLFGQLNLFNSLRQHLPQAAASLPPLPQPQSQIAQPPQLPLPPLPSQLPLSLTNPLFNEHIYKQLISLNLKHQHLQNMVMESQSRHKLDSPPLPSTKKEFSIESLLRPSTEQSSRTPSPSARKTPTSDYEADITPVNLKIFP